MIHPPTGEFANGTFHFPVRVYYEDTDQQGIVFYANYLKYLERGRTEFLRHVGAPPIDIEAQFDRVFVVAHLDIRYHGSAKLDDILVVQTTISSFGRVRLTMEQKIYCEDVLVTTALVTLAIINGQGRPARLSKDLEDRLQHAFQK